MRRPPSHYLIFAALAVLPGLAGCSRSAPEGASGKGGKRGGETVPIVAATVQTKTMPLQILAIGNVRPKATVAVKPRVTGQIAEVHFHEGQDVKAGDVLVEIDPAPFEVILAQAKARLTQAETQAAIARKQANRYTNMATSGGVSKEEVDNFKSTADAADSNTAAAAAAVKEAELQLSYCTVRSPLAGRAGRRVVDSGNVVKADETDLVIINQLKPIEVIFSVPEQYFDEVQRYRQEAELEVTFTPSNGRESKGTLTFVDNAIKPATGTLEVKATMENEDLSLWPGQFGEVALTLVRQPNSLVVPATAVQTGQKGPYVFVVKDDRTVDLRDVELVRTVGGEAILRKGVSEGEVVVIDGHLRLARGTKVEVKPSVGTQGAQDSAAKVSQAAPAKP